MEASLMRTRRKGQKHVRRISDNGRTHYICTEYWNGVAVYRYALALNNTVIS
jgi:hypothetical protein